nr:MAG TPA: hypothetical protein [Caudoviricetes sp.]
MFYLSYTQCLSDDLKVCDLNYATLNSMTFNTHLNK